MEIIFSKRFSKKYDKLSKGLKEKFKLKLIVFSNDIKDPILNIHSLHGSYDGFYSFNVNADYRVIFRYAEIEIVELVMIGTHSELYK